eukprot:2518483-Rhodomonas_salina.1
MGEGGEEREREADEQWQELLKSLKVLVPVPLSSCACSLRCPVLRYGIELMSSTEIGIRYAMPGTEIAVWKAMS